MRICLDTPRLSRFRLASGGMAPVHGAWRGGEVETMAQICASCHGQAGVPAIRRFR